MKNVVHSIIHTLKELLVHLFTVNATKFYLFSVLHISTRMGHLQVLQIIYITHKMDAIGPSETSVDFRGTTRRCIPADESLLIQIYFKSRLTFLTETDVHLLYFCEVYVKFLCA
jgi:hypothetical protein